MAPKRKGKIHAHPKKKVHKRTGFEKWAQTLITGSKQSEFDMYDQEIDIALKEFDTVLTGVPGYVPIHPKLIKAMLCVESDGPASPDDSWYTNPIQMAHLDDPGIDEVKTAQRVSGEELVRPPNLLTRISKDLATTGSLSPETGIRAAICYILMWAGTYARRTVLDPTDKEIHTFTIEPGDNGLEKLAHRLKTTQANIKELNPGFPDVLHANDKKTYNYQKASVQPYIVSMRRITPDFVAKIYNNNPAKTADYLRKLHFALDNVLKDSGGAKAKGSK